MATERTSDNKSKSTSRRSRQVADPASPTQQGGVAGPEMLAMQGAIENVGTASPIAVLRLQQAAGNRAVQRLIAQRKVQAKLTVGPAHDKYEEEADRTAATVMRMSAPDTSTTHPKLGDDEIRTKPMPVTHLIRTKRSQSESGFDAGSGIEQRLSANKGSGSALPDGTRMFMESRFGTDFSGVRVHTGGESNQLNRSMQAQAFTHGSDIYFNQGKYDPASSSGRQLLAHELTHVVQQSGPGVARKVQRKLDFFTTGTTDPAPKTLTDLGITRAQYDLLSPTDQTAIKDAYENGTGTDQEAIAAAKTKVDAIRGQTGVVAQDSTGKLKGINLAGTSKTAQAFKLLSKMAKKKFMKKNKAAVVDMTVVTGLSEAEYAALEDPDRTLLDSKLGGEFGKLEAKKLADDWRANKYKFTFDDSSDLILGELGLSREQYNKLDGGDKTLLKDTYNMAFVGKQLAKTEAERLKNEQTTELVSDETGEKQVGVKFHGTGMTAGQFANLSSRKIKAFFKKFAGNLDRTPYVAVGLTQEQFDGMDPADKLAVSTAYKEPVVGKDKAKALVDDWIKVGGKYKYDFKETDNAHLAEIGLTRAQYDKLEAGPKGDLKNAYNEVVIGKVKAKEKAEKLKKEMTVEITRDKRDKKKTQHVGITFEGTNMTETTFAAMSPKKQREWIALHAGQVKDFNALDVGLTQEQFNGLDPVDQGELATKYKEPIVGKDEAKKLVNDWTTGAYPAPGKYNFKFDDNDDAQLNEIGITKAQYNKLMVGEKRGIKDEYEIKVIGPSKAKERVETLKQKKTVSLVENAKGDKNIGIRFGETDMTPEQYAKLPEERRQSFIVKQTAHVEKHPFVPVGITQEQFDALTKDEQQELSDKYKEPITGPDEAKKLADDWTTGTFPAPGKYNVKWADRDIEATVKDIGLTPEQAKWVKDGPPAGITAFDPIKVFFDAAKISGPAKAKEEITKAVDAIKPLATSTDAELYIATGLTRAQYDWLRPGDKAEVNRRFETPLAGPLLSKHVVETVLAVHANYKATATLFDGNNGTVLLALGFTRPPPKKGQPPPPTTKTAQELAVDHFNTMSPHAKTQIETVYNEPFGGTDRARRVAFQFRIASIVRPTKLQRRMEALGGNPILGITSTSTGFVGDAFGTTSSIINEVNKPTNPDMTDSYAGTEAGNATGITGGTISIVSGGISTVSNTLELAGKGVELHHGRKLRKHGGVAGKQLGNRMRRRGALGVVDKSMGVLGGLAGIGSGSMAIGQGERGLKGDVTGQKDYGTAGNVLNVVGGGIQALQESVGLVSTSVSVNSARKRKNKATNFTTANPELKGIATFVSENMNMGGKSLGIMKNISGMLGGASKVIGAAGGLGDNFLLNVIAAGVGSLLGLVNFGLSTWMAKRNARKMKQLKQKVSTTSTETIIGEKINKLMALIKDVTHGAEAVRFCMEVLDIRPKLDDAKDKLAIVEMVDTDKAAFKQLLMGKMQKYE